MPDFGRRGEPPAIYRYVSAQAQAESGHIKMLPMTLEPAAEPVWREEEARDEEERLAAGRQVPALATDAEAREIALQVRAALPDRLLGCVLKLPPDGPLPTARFDYYIVAVPTTFATLARGITPRRLALDLTLGDARSTTPPRIPIACDLRPGTHAATETTSLGKFEIDLGKAVTQIWPGLPDVFTARTGGSLDIKRLRTRIQASGKGRRECEWLISAVELIHDFSPSCIIQAPQKTRLSIEARLRVEVWKRVALAFRKTYLIQAKPMRYVMASWVKPTIMTMGAGVTLDSPSAS